MADRPYTLLSCSMSLDGFIDHASESRLLLSNDLDFDRVDRVRAGVDAILVGATTVRNDNPRLRVRDPERRKKRLERGLPEHPLKVTVTEHGRLDPSSRFFDDDGSEKLVVCNTRVLGSLRTRMRGVCDVYDGGDPVQMRSVAEELHRRGVGRLMVEGGGHVHTQFLAADLVDELHLVVAPFFVGEPGARRFVGEGPFPFHPGRRAVLAETHQLGDVVLLRYALSDRFDRASLQLPG